MSDDQPVKQTPAAKTKRDYPTSMLDAQMLMTDSKWGRTPESPELGSVTHDFEVTYPAGTLVKTKDKDGNERILKFESAATIYSEQGSWGLLAYMTRDLRLGNLTRQQDTDLCIHYLDLAGDCLQMGYHRAFAAAIRRVAHVLEVSQSRKGFLRKILNTFRQEVAQGELEPSKKSFGFGKKKEGY